MNANLNLTGFGLIMTRLAIRHAFNTSNMTTTTAKIRMTRYKEKFSG